MDNFDHHYIYLLQNIIIINQININITIIVIVIVVHSAIARNPYNFPFAVPLQILNRTIIQYSLEMATTIRFRIITPIPIFIIIYKANFHLHCLIFGEIKYLFVNLLSFDRILRDLRIL